MFAVVVKKVLLPLLLLGLAVAGAAQLIQSRPQRPPVEAAEQVWRIATIAAAPGRHASELTLYGKIDSPRTSTLTAALTADVIDVPVAEGEAVDAGQTLARLDDREARLLVAQREAELAQIVADIDSERIRHDNDRQSLPNEQTLLQLRRKAVQRARDLASRNVGAQAALDDAMQGVQQQQLAINSRRAAIDAYQARVARLQASRARAEALLAMAELNLSRSVIRAPFAGRISGVDVSPGDRVRQGERLFELFDAQALRVRAQIPNRHVPQVRAALQTAQDAGLAAQAQVDGAPLTLTLRRIGSRVGAGGAVEALFDVVSGGAALPLGRFITLQLTLAEMPNVLALPTEAVYGMDRIYSVAAGRLVSHQARIVGEIRLPAERGHRLLIAAPDIQAGQPLLATQLPNAIAGLRVQAVDADTE